MERHTAGDGMTFVRTADGVRYGHSICLSSSDNISAYHEEPMTDEEKSAENWNAEANVFSMRATYGNNRNIMLDKFKRYSRASK